MPKALLTDLYELTMMAGYWAQGKGEDTAIFDLYFRELPFGGGYAIAAGLETVARAVQNLRFDEEAIAYLREQTTRRGGRLFDEGFLDYLRQFRFSGDIKAVPEGTVVFPNEPLVRVSGKLIEAQLLESLLLCLVNYATLVATKAARVWEASGRGSVIEFGMRRAPGPDGALTATRATFIGGCEGTSNVLAGQQFGIPTRGTMAHSWVMAFPSELEAFRAYARVFPDSCILLVDTYDVLGSGVPNAIVVARELEAAGHRLLAVRLDSGELAEQSRRVRAMLDEAGLHYVKIFASGDLDEERIAETVARGGKVDAWGVGTNLVAAAGVDGGTLGGVYKLVEHNGQPRIKVSESPAKTTNPGRKKVLRFRDSMGRMVADAIALENEAFAPGQQVTIIEPASGCPQKVFMAASVPEEVLVDVFIGGQLVYEFPSLTEVRARCAAQLDELPEACRRLSNPHRYDVGLTPQAWGLKRKLMAALGGRL